MSCAIAQTGPVFHAVTETVLVPTSVLDKRGRPVTGLKLDDFELRVDGKLVRIAGVDEVTAASRSRTNVVSLPSGTITNMPPIDAAQQSWVVLLLDFLNTSLPDRMLLRKELIKFFANGLRPGQPIAIYALGSSLTLVHPFTSDPRALIDTASHLMHQSDLPPSSASAGFVAPAPANVAGVVVTSPNGVSLLAPEGGAGVGGDIEDFLLSSQWQLAVYQNRARAEDTLAQFRELANSFAGVAGKKTVLWLTGDASPLNPTLMNMTNLFDPASVPLRVQQRDLTATYDVLNSANISLFPVDIRGVTNPGLKKPDETPNHPDFMQSLALNQSGEYSSMVSRREGEAGNAVMAMQTAAVETGGRVLRGNNDLGELLQHAQNLWSSYYVLAFSPPQETRAKSPVYHRIEVKVPGQPVEVLCRQGFMSRPESFINSDSELKRDVADASNSPVDLTAIPLTLRLLPEDNGASGGKARFMLAIPAARLAHTDMRHGSRYNFSIFIVEKDASGKMLSDLGDKIDRVFPSSEAMSIANHGFLYPGQFDSPGSKKTFGRIIVRDNLSGRLGTITIQIGKD